MRRTTGSYGLFSHEPRSSTPTCFSLGKMDNEKDMLNLFIMSVQEWTQWSMLVFYTVLIVFWFCGSLVSVEHRKNMFFFLYYIATPTGAGIVRWRDVNAISSDISAELVPDAAMCVFDGKACSSASFVAGCGVVYPRLVPPSLGIYPWVLHIVIVETVQFG